MKCETMKPRSLRRQFVRYARAEARAHGAHLVREGKTLHYHNAWRTDEGWASRYATFDLSTFTVTFGSAGADCDGRMSDSRTFRFQGIDRTRTRQVRTYGPEYAHSLSAHLVRVSRYHRDYRAEEYGY